MVFFDSPFSWSIEGIPLICHNPTVQGFKELLQLPSQNYSTEAILCLLKCPSLMEKRGFSASQIPLLTRWFELAEIKEELSGDQNSWEEGLCRLLYGLGQIPDDNTVLDLWPTSCIPHSEIDLFNCFLVVFFELKQDLLCLSQKKTIPEWLAFLLEIAEKYFVIEWDKQPFFQELKSLYLSYRLSNPIALCHFESIWRILEHLFQKPQIKTSWTTGEKIRFVSLASGNMTPARILWCLGMNEEDFPRKDFQSSLCQMSQDFVPSKTEADRSAFLQALTLAKDYLIFSYERVHVEDGQHQSPCLLIEELNHYLQKRGLRPGMMRIDDSTATAPKLPVNCPCPFLPQGLDKPLESPIEVSLPQIKKLASNPLQFYFNESLGIYLKRQEDEDSSAFLLSHLQKHLMRRQAMQIPIGKILDKLKAQGKMPCGIFQEISALELQEEMEDLLTTLGQFCVNPEQIHSVRLDPPLEISLTASKTVYITGELDNVTPQGLLAYADSDLKSLVKIWPLYLIYCCIYPENPFLLLTKSQERLEIELGNPREALACYLEYLLASKEEPSPLMPEWAKAVLQGSDQDFQAALSKESTDPYVNYLKRRSGLGELKSPLLTKAFSPLLAKVCHAV